MNYIRVEGSGSLARDAKTGAIVNINSTEIEQARQRKKASKLKEQEMNAIKEDVANLKNDMSDIKALLQQLVEK